MGKQPRRDPPSFATAQAHSCSGPTIPAWPSLGFPQTNQGPDPRLGSLPFSSKVSAQHLFYIVHFSVLTRFFPLAYSISSIRDKKRGAVTVSVILVRTTVNHTVRKPSRKRPGQDGAPVTHLSTSSFSSEALTSPSPPPTYESVTESNHPLGESPYDLMVSGNSPTHTQR